VLELQHYGMMKKLEQDWSWRGVDGSEYGAQYFENALRQMHATFIGYHGYAREWLADNPNLTRKFANLCGYWYFLQSASWPETARGGDNVQLSLTWLNRGVAPSLSSLCAQGASARSPRRCGARANVFGCRQYEVDAARNRCRKPASEVADNRNTGRVLD
jgi:hypothetical protein